jgi:alkylation response protein AidB-like acyl-CoA dehydrogenase
MVDRRQFGSTLFEHQALRLRVADLQARVDLLRHGLNGIAAEGRLDLRAAAAVKVTGARLGEEVLSECMHISAAQAIWWTRRRSAGGGGT